MDMATVQHRGNRKILPSVTGYVDDRAPDNVLRIVDGRGNSRVFLKKDLEKMSFEIYPGTPVYRTNNIVRDFE